MNIQTFKIDDMEDTLSAGDTTGNACACNIATVISDS